jgi:hypothetical protein
MSKNTHAKMNYSTDSIQINHWNNSDDAFKKPLYAFRNNNIPLTYPPDPPVNKNGFSGKNKKREAKNINLFESKSEVKIPKILTIPKNTSNIFSQNDKQSLLNNSTTSFQTKYLEPRNNNFSELGDFSNIPDFEKHLYNANMHFNLNEQHFLLCPLISKVFTQKKIMANNYIYSNRKRFLIKKSKNKSCKSYSLKSNLKKKEIL